MDIVETEQDILQTNGERGAHKQFIFMACNTVV